MPLDGHSYLVAQGWSGKGNGLRKGAISRPLAIPQKKTLSGLGKDRDEAFPFWDHLFTAAASTIKIKVISDDEDEENSDSSSTVILKRTSTGILSNRRPVSGTAANSGTTTPDSEAPRLNLLANAKREAAKRGLYSRFFRGPILGPDEGDISTLSPGDLSNPTCGVTVMEEVQVELTRGKTKRKSEDATDEQKERKRRKREPKEGKAEKKKREVIETSEVTESREQRKQERRREKEARKEAKRIAKELKQIGVNDGEDNEIERRHKRKEKDKRTKSSEATQDDSLTCIPPAVEAGDKQTKGRCDIPNHISEGGDTSHKKKRKRRETSDY